MRNYSFIDFLSTNLQLNPEELNYLTESCQRREFEKGDFAEQIGQKSKYTFFVEAGLMRMYSIDEKGKEHILQFAPESWFVSDRESVYFNRESGYFIQALESTRVLLLTEEFIRNLEDTIPTFRNFNNRLLHNHIRHLQFRINQLLSTSAEERYLSFIEMYPNVLLRVPQTMVASYLGITPESLSRVRKALAEKNQKHEI